MNGSFLDQLVPDVAERVCYICSPQGYMDEAIEMVHKRGVPLPKIYTESFEPRA